MEENYDTNFTVNQSKIIGRILRIEATLDTLVLMQSQIISKLEDRPKQEVYDNAQKDITKNLQDLTDMLKNK
jgi:hypothetical protein